MVLVLLYWHWPAEGPRDCPLTRPGARGFQFRQWGPLLVTEIHKKIQVHNKLWRAACWKESTCWTVLLYYKCSVEWSRLFDFCVCVCVCVCLCARACVHALCLCLHNYFHSSVCMLPTRGLGARAATNCNPFLMNESAKKDDSMQT